MSRAKIEVIDTGNIGIYADFGSDSQDDDWERKQIEKEDEEIRDFVKCHPMPSPDDEEGETFWKKVIDRMKSGGRGKEYDDIYVCKFWHYEKDVWKPDW